MSMKTWINYGIGVCTSELEIKSLEAIKALVALSPCLEKDLKEYFEDCEIESPEIADYLEYDEDCRSGLAYLLQRVINDVENLMFTACDDYEGRIYLIYQPSYPWDMTDKEKSLSEADIKDILAKYLSMVTDDDLDVGEIEAENFG